MFNSKKEFAQALLDGRKFTIDGKDRFEFLHRYVNPFRYIHSNGDENITMNGYWTLYDKVKELFHEPEQGDRIKVRNNGCSTSHLRIFITMYQGKFLCKKESNSLFSLWDERVG